MELSGLLRKWSGIRDAARVIVVADDGQSGIADMLKREGVYDVQVMPFPLTDGQLNAIRALHADELLMVALSFDSYVQKGGNRLFSAFAKPEGVQARYIFLRLGISLQSLIQGLSTDKKRVYDKIAEMDALAPGQVRVKNASGTDILCRINPFVTCSHEIIQDGGMAFLPPSETSSRVLAADGRIVVDITAGQLYHDGQLLGYFGRVSSPVTLIVENGSITQVQGDGMAEEIREKLFCLPPACRQLVELGQGLSDMQPTGIIGVDESIMTTCHFGFGDGGVCGTHWDVVIASPMMEKE